MGGKVKKPTYKQIQAYVLETHGLKVSPLYIANVKDEFGLEKQFSYEEAGMSAKKRPNCPPEKRAGDYRPRSSTSACWTKTPEETE